MKVLVVGAEGFIGRHVVRALRAAGHQVVRGVHRPAKTPDEVSADLSRDDVDAWARRLSGVHAVVNAAGIFREEGADTFAVLNDAGPRALFAACEAAAMRKVVQISALGADARAESRFHLSKKNADDYLSTRTVPWVVVQPSIVFGPGGASAGLFLMLASLPVVPLPGDGHQRVQPIHIDDLVALVVRLIESDAGSRARIAAVGPRAVSVREWLGALRGQLGLRRARFIGVPLAAVRRAIGAEPLGMLMRGNVASPTEVTAILGREPRPVEEFVRPEDAPRLRREAKLEWLLTVLRVSVALVWIVSGLVSLGIYPVGQSLELLARVGLAGGLAYAALYGGALLDIVLGLAALGMKRRRWVWRVQAAVMLGYTAIITAFLPELWLHPFGPVFKNLPLLAAIALLHELEEG